jgi:hypothetical protein
LSCWILLLLPISTTRPILYPLPNTPQILNRLQRPPFQLRQHLPLVLALLALPALPPLFLASLHLLLCVPDTSTVPAFTASTILDHLASAKTGLAEFFASPAPDATVRTDHETDAAHCRARHVIAQHLATDLHQLNDRHLAALTATNAGVDATACADARRTKALVLIGAEYRVAGSRALGKLLLVRDLATAAAPGRLQDVHWSREEGARECRNARVEGFLREFGGVTRRRGNLEELREVARALLEEERGGPVGEGRGRWGEVGW